MIIKAVETAAKEFDATIVSKMNINKAYLYKIFTDIFIEFDSMTKLNVFVEYAKNNLHTWDEDQYLIIDTSKIEVVARWSHSIENADKIVMSVNNTTDNSIVIEYKNKYDSLFEKIKNAIGNDRFNDAMMEATNAGNVGYETMLCIAIEKLRDDAGDFDSAEG